jgi:CBS domain containing-hemolysin-like protein
MDPSSILKNLFIIAFLLFVNGFFVSAEFALVKVRKTRLEQLCNEGNNNAKIALKLTENMNRMLAAAQLGVTIASIALGWVAEVTIVQLVEPLIRFVPYINGSLAAHAIAVPISFVLVTYFHVLFVYLCISFGEGSIFVFHLWINENKNYSEVSPHTSQNETHQKFYK